MIEINNELILDLYMKVKRVLLKENVYWHKRWKMFMKSSI